MSVIGDLLVRIGADTSAMSSGLKRAQGDLEGFSDKFAAMGDKISSAGKSLSAMVTVPLVGMAGVAIKLAADAEESASKMEAVFGPATANMNKWIEDLKGTIPGTTRQLQDMSSGIQDLLVPLGMAPPAAEKLTKQVVTLAGDLASFNNMPVEEALDRIRAGMVGSYEPALRFGVALSAATVEAEALRMGLIAEGGELTANARAQAALSLIMKGTTAAHGDAAKTADSAANSMKFLARDTKELGVTIGNILLPVVTPMVQRMATSVKMFEKLSPATQKLVVVVGGLVAAVGPLLIVFGSVLSALPAIGAAMSVLMGPVGLVIAGVAALTAGWVKANGGIGKTIEAMVGRVQQFKAKAMPVFTDVSKKVTEFGKTVSEIFAKHIAPRLKAMTPMFEQVGRIVTRVVNGIIVPTIAKLTPTFKALGPIVLAVVDVLTVLGKVALHVVSGVLLPLLTGFVRVATTLFNGPLRLAIEAVSLLLRGLAATFKWLYDKVVGNSYVPDMVAGIATEFGSLDAVMVKPTVSGTGQVAAAMETMATSGVASLKKLSAEEKKRAELWKSQTAANEDRIRQAKQEYELSLLNGSAAERLRINFGALNETLEARRTLTGALLQQTLAAIETEKQWQIQALTMRAVTAETKALTPSVGGLGSSISSLLTPAAKESVIATQRMRSEFQALGGTLDLVEVKSLAATSALMGSVGMGGGGTLGGLSGAISAAGGMFREAGSLTLSFMAGIGSTLKGVGSKLIGMFNPLSIVATMLDQAFRATAETMKPLMDIAGQIATVLAEALKPVIEALVPIFRGLAPIVAAVGQIMGALFKAFTPIFGALVPLLEALFPVFKFVAIVTTYLGQVFTKAAEIILNVSSAIYRVVGKIISGLFGALSKIPVIGKAFKGLASLGDAMVRTADTFGAMADGFGNAFSELGAAREQIKGISLVPSSSVATSSAPTSGGALVEEMRASVRVQQEAERRQAERDERMYNELADIRREFRWSLEGAAA